MSGMTEMYTVCSDERHLSLQESEKYNDLSNLLEESGFKKVRVIEEVPLSLIRLDHGDRKDVYGLYFNHLLVPEPLPKDIIEAARKIGYNISPQYVDIAD